MANCRSDVRITGRAAVLDVTPDSKTAPKVD
jgi:cytochrome c